jgi:SWI/SNF-related matrix-associated actin-dependent regulator 1 of chromatin subfamily A
VPHIIAIGGTPLTNKPIELFPTLNIVRPDKFHNFYSFAHKYSRAKRTKWGWDFSEARNLDKLHRRLKKLCMIRRLKKKVLKGLPPKTREVVPLEINNRREYGKAESDFLKWLGEQSPTKAKRARKAQELVKVGELKRLAAKLKLPGVFEWIDNFLERSDEKLLVFSIHKFMMKELLKRYGKIAVHIDGDVSPKKRKHAIRAFLNQHRIRILFGQSDAIGTGVDGLQKACHNGVFVEIGWTPADIGQPEDRLHRIGQKYPVNITLLVAHNTIEEKLCKIIQKKQRILDKTLDGIGGDSKMDIYRSLLRKLKH